MPPTSTTSSIWAGRQAGVLQRLAAGLDRALDEVVDQRLVFGARQLQREVFGTRSVGGDVGQVDVGLRRRREFDLGLFGRLLEALQRELVLGQVDALLLLELARQILNQAHVEIFAAEEGVAVGRLHLEHAVADLEDRDVEGAAAEVIDRDGAGLLLVEAIGERRGRRLVDDAQHFEAGDLAGVLGRLTLGVVEIGGHGDDGLSDRASRDAPPPSPSSSARRRRRSARANSACRPPTPMRRRCRRLTIL